MDSATAGAAPDDATDLLIRRLRFALLAALGPIALFALFDLRLEPDRLAELWLVKLAGVAALAAAFVALRRPRSRRFVVTTALGTTAFLYGLSSYSAILVREPFTTPLLSISVAIGTATLLPWGVLPQLWVAGISALCTVVTVEQSTGTFWSLVTYPNVGVAIGLGMSVYIASELERNRRELAHHEAERRRAEERILLLNADLERRVVERTAELETEVAERREAQAELTALIENTEAGIWSVDRSYHVIAFNSVMAERYRLLFAEPLNLGLRIVDHVPPDWQERWTRMYDRALAGERFAVEDEIEMPEGRRWYAISFNPIVSDGAVTGVTVFSSDITERKRAADIERRRQAELAHVLRLGTMGEMAAGLAHEINQPLAAIVNFARGCSMRLREGARDVGDMVEAIDAIAVEALRAGEIIRRIRRLVRKENPREDLVALEETVNDVVPLLQSEIRQLGITVETHFDEDLPRVAADRVQIEQVLLNLLRNAIDAMAESASPRRLSIVAGALDAGRVELTVEDSGPGFSASEVERIFDPFYTTKNSGLGMGLSISRSIAEAHRGHLTAVPIRSGAKFVLTLPAAPAHVRQAAPDLGDASVHEGERGQAL